MRFGHEDRLRVIAECPRCNPNVLRVDHVLCLQRIGTFEFDHDFDALESPVT
ncbi:hypothetical protein J4G37_27685 [Microvirga sp. 3-52]|nr:hypothetical protein [Microvirga sp. 3-52]